MNNCLIIAANRVYMHCSKIGCNILAHKDSEDLKVRTASNHFHYKTLPSSFFFFLRKTK